MQDKTFGLKNKKGAKTQKFIAQVEKQVKSGGDPRFQKLEQERLAEKKRKEEAQKLEEERKAIFKPVTTQKVEAGKFRTKNSGLTVLITLDYFAICLCHGDNVVRLIMFFILRKVTK